MLPPSTETAKYTRQQELKEIHDSFMKTYKSTNNKGRLHQKPFMHGLLGYPPKLILKLKSSERGTHNY